MMYSYFGICPDARESLILFEAVKRGIIPTITDRLSEEERKEIVSGAIYIWDERKNPMRRWTDGRTWSNSRVVGDFLEYRESIPDPLSNKAGKYVVKPYGLRKRSICLPACEDRSLRLIAYFTSSDVKKGTLVPPSANPRFAGIVQTMDKNPQLHESLNLLALGKRRKRAKSIKASKQEQENAQMATAPYMMGIPGNSYMVPPFYAPMNAYPDPVNTHMVPAAPYNYTMMPPAGAQIVYQTQMGSVPVVGPNTTISPMYAAAVPQDQSKPADNQDIAASGAPQNVALPNSALPSPVWMPLVMNSEDRRALHLLNSR